MVEIRCFCRVQLLTDSILVVRSLFDHWWIMIRQCFSPRPYYPSFRLHIFIMGLFWNYFIITKIIISLIMLLLLFLCDTVGFSPWPLAGGSSYDWNAQWVSNIPAFHHLHRLHKQTVASQIQEFPSFILGNVNFWNAATNVWAAIRSGIRRNQPLSSPSLICME